MHKMPRTSLAALVCPSAPFLAPRLLRTAIPAASRLIQREPTAPRQKWHYATKARGKDPERRWTMKPKKREALERENETLALLKQLHQACEIRNVQQIMDLYPTLVSASALQPQDSRRIAQALHVRARNKAKASDLMPFVQRLVDDLCSGLLPPQQYAFVHLLGIYKAFRRFEEGSRLWGWLVQQDDTYVSQAAYGAAIELMAYGGLSSLEDLEDLYSDGLKRFPGTFAEYHLSPDAVVPDRSQHIVVAGIPTVLLQGILTARILARDWRRSYLALDTILRLYPTQTPARFFELFIIERPVEEAYTAFSLACRAGVVLSPSLLTRLMTRLRSTMEASRDLSDRVLLLRGAANAIYAYQQAGGKLHNLHIGVFIHLLGHLLPERQAHLGHETDTVQYRDAVALFAHEFLAGLVHAGFVPDSHPFEALVAVAGRLRVPGLLNTALEDTKTTRIDLGSVGRRSALKSAGLLEDTELVQQLWSDIVSEAETEGTQLDFEYWITFAKACRGPNLAEYFESQLSALSHTLHGNAAPYLQVLRERQENPLDDSDFTYMNSEEFNDQMNGLKQQMKNVEAVVMSGQPLDMTQSPFYMHINPNAPPLASNDSLRAVYDQLTTDPHQPAPPLPTDDQTYKPPTSSTGIRLDELRFRNWVTVHEMMDDAEQSEVQFQHNMNKAIANGEPFDRSQSGLGLRKALRLEMESKDQLRDKIRALRNPH